MTLTTHIVAGAAGARLFAGNPVEGFIIGWLSHYVLDSIIHWDYPLASAKPEQFIPTSDTKISIFNRAFVGDFVKISFDLALGFVIAFMFLTSRADPKYLLLLVGGLGGVVPDFLQFVFLVWKNKILKNLQRFHNMLHAKTKLTNPILGITSQIALILVILFLFNFTY